MLKSMMLGHVIKRYRAAENIGVRALSKDIGISAATLNRIERGENCDAKSLKKIFIWLLEDYKP